MLREVLLLLFYFSYAIDYSFIQSWSYEGSSITSSRVGQFIGEILKKSTLGLLFTTLDRRETFLMNKTSYHSDVYNKTQKLFN